MTQNGFTVKDSGQRQEFSTGARRDMAEGKLRPSWMLSVYTQIRLAAHMTLGALKYGPRNYEKGIPDSSFADSLESHWLAWKAGLRDEDHLAAVIFNANGLITNEEAIKHGQLAVELHDIPVQQGAEQLYRESKAAVQAAVDAKKVPDKSIIPVNITHHLTNSCPKGWSHAGQC